MSTIVKLLWLVSKYKSRVKNKHNNNNNLKCISVYKKNNSNDFEKL